MIIPPKLVNLKKIIKNLTLLFIIFIILTIGLYYHVQSSYKNKIYYDISAIPNHDVALVFGAAVWSTLNRPSHALEDRILSAVELYKNNKVKKIIMSGDNSIKEYNEPIVMKNYAVDLGVNPDDIISTMDETDVFIEEAADVAMQAIKDGVARVPISREEAHNIAKNDISYARRMTHELVDKGFIKAPPQEMLQKVLAEVIKEV